MTPESGRLVLRVSAGRVFVGVRTRPGAAVTRLVGTYGDRLKVEVAAPAEAGRANRELVRAVAGWAGVPARDVTVEVGHTSRDKVLALSGIDGAVLRERLGCLLGVALQDE